MTCSQHNPYPDDHSVIIKTNYTQHNGLLQGLVTTPLHTLIYIDDK